MRLILVIGCLISCQLVSNWPVTRWCLYQISQVVNVLILALRLTFVNF